MKPTIGFTEALVSSPDPTLARGVGTRLLRLLMLLLRFDSMTLSMAVDVPFESVQEITLKLARYEELFKYRYTEKDEGYRQTTQRPPRYVVSLLT